MLHKYTENSGTLPEQRVTSNTQTTLTGRREFLAVTAFGWLWPPYWFRNHVDVAGVRFRRIKNGPEGRHYFFVHGNERTAHDVLVEHMKQVTGRAWLATGTVRNAEIMGGQIDPNRMFSRAGAERNLQKLNPSWTPEQLKRALNRLDSDRERFLKRLLPPGGQVIVALHNNSEGYSMTDELPISDAVSLNDKDHPHEFMLCTQSPDFQVLSAGPFNVLLQNAAPKEDDGSLSRLCAKRGVRYVNIEAAAGNAAGQQKMLHWIERVL
ncbi:MAG: hypothetical protein H7Y20_16610 [Bryobacteraceae bacterium]|nr:hypothetical protein [Bryobacteraceae bacterium]